MWGRDIAIAGSRGRALCQCVLRGDRLASPRRWIAISRAQCAQCASASCEGRGLARRDGVYVLRGDRLASPFTAERNRRRRRPTRLIDRLRLRVLGHRRVLGLRDQPHRHGARAAARRGAFTKMLLLTEEQRLIMWLTSKEEEESVELRLRRSMHRSFVRSFVRSRSMASVWRGRRRSTRGIRHRASFEQREPVVTTPSLSKRLNRRDATTG